MNWDWEKLQQKRQKPPGAGGGPDFRDLGQGLKRFRFNFSAWKIILPIIVGLWLLSGIYIVIAGLLGRLDGWWKFAIHHLVLLILIFAVSRIKIKKWNLLSFVRYLYPLFLYGSMYRETHEIDQVIFTKPLDYYFIVWDKLLFNSQPSIDFANYINAPWFSEIMHFFYF